MNDRHWLGEMKVKHGQIPYVHSYLAILAWSTLTNLSIPTRTSLLMRGAGHIPAAPSVRSPAYFDPALHQVPLRQPLAAKSTNATASSIRATPSIGAAAEPSRRAPPRRAAAQTRKSLSTDVDPKVAKLIEQDLKHQTNLVKPKSAAASARSSKAASAGAVEKQSLKEAPSSSARKLDASGRTRAPKKGVTKVVSR
ncbi:hypothetical protein LTR17_009586 [Elasticomyces elasticus]|nr:hypothetical protein LTR17_009586 [Elasticomyces elasticus]